MICKSCNYFGLTESGYCIGCSRLESNCKCLRSPIMNTYFSNQKQENAATPINNFMHNSMQKTFKNCLDIAVRKSNDNANSENPFKNFETVTRLGIPVVLGILIRFLDRVSRLENFLKLVPTKQFVVDESVEDTINDAINYLAILKARIEFEKIGLVQMDK